MQKDLFILALVMAPVIALSGVGVKACQAWASRETQQQQPMGGIWQLAVSCTAIRCAAVLAEAYALVGLMIGL